MKRFEVEERSMAPALLPGDYLLTLPARSLRRGAIVVAQCEDRAVIKRVIGLGGERIEIRAGTVEIDGSALQEPWTIDSTEPDGSWLVEPDSVFLLGDARHRSRGDSRDSGPITLLNIDRVIFRYWPASRIGRPL